VQKVGAQRTFFKKNTIEKKKRRKEGGRKIAARIPHNLSDEYSGAGKKEEPGKEQSVHSYGTESREGKEGEKKGREEGKR